MASRFLKFSRSGVPKLGCFSVQLSRQSAIRHNSVRIVKNPELTPKVKEITEEVLSLNLLEINQFLIYTRV